MNRLTMASNKGGVALTFDLNITCEKTEIEKILKLAEKLKEYEDLEEQGKLLRLPCALGDTVYVLRIDNTAYMMNNEKVWEIVDERFEIRHFDCIGKTVFLTRPEAERALTEMEGNE